jgi:hypothetical protein
LVIHEAREVASLVSAIGIVSWLVIIEGNPRKVNNGRVAATGQGNKALGVGIEEGIGKGKTVALPCSRMGLRVLPKGDHMKAKLTLKGSGASSGMPRAVRTLETKGRGGISDHSATDKDKVG